MVRVMLGRMRLRDAAFDPRESEPSPSGDAPDGVRRWRVSRSLVMVKGLGTAALCAVALLYHAYPDRLTVSVAGALVVGVLLVRDLLVPVRLEADPGGVTVVSGFAGRRRLDWSEVERVRVDDRRRLGL